MKGIVIQLSPEAAESLRRGGGGQQQQDEQVQEQRAAEEDWNEVIPLLQHSTQQQPQPPQPVTAAASASASDAAASPTFLSTDTTWGSSVMDSNIVVLSEDDEDDVDVIDHVNNDHEDIEDYFDSDENDSDDDGDDEPLLSSWPAILIDLQRLVGYKPQSLQDAERLQHEIRSALLSSNSPSSSPSPSDHEPPVAGGCFERRVAELLDTKIARHDETNLLEEESAAATVASLEYARIDYPETFVVVVDYDDDDETTRRKVVSTARLWKKLLRHQYPLSGNKNIPDDTNTNVVHRLLWHLRNCSRTLTWKCDMRKEILRLAQRELRYCQWQEWNHSNGRRADELDKLYRVRETIHAQVAVMQDRVERLEAIREEVVQQRLLHQRIHLGGTGGLGGFDLESSLFLLEEEEEGDAVGSSGLMTDLDYCDDEYAAFSASDDYDDGDSCYDDDDDDDDESGDNDDDEQASQTEQQGQEQSTTTTAATAENNILNEKEVAALLRRRQRRSQQQKQKLQQKRQQQQEQKLALQQQKYRAALQAEDDMRQVCTTLELKSAQAMAASLEVRLNQVDELLESLQEEEWQQQQDREEYENGDNNEQAQELGDANATTTTGPSQLSVLDEILAMILGSIPPPLPPPSNGNDNDDTPNNTNISSSTTLTHNNSNSYMYDHLAWLRNEHRTIVSEWKEHFGRVPPPLQRTTRATASRRQPELEREPPPQAQVSPSSFVPEQQQDSHFEDLGGRGGDSLVVGDRQQQLKQSFGIEDKDHVDHWEDDDDEDDGAFLPNKNHVRPPPLPRVASISTTTATTSSSNKSEPPKLVGLRPGGRAVR